MKSHKRRNELSCINVMKPNYRRCVSCRAIAPKRDLWRVVRQHSTGAVELDQGMGRSAYLCPDLKCLQAAQKKEAFEQSAEGTRTRDDLSATLATPPTALHWGSCQRRSRLAIEEG